MKRAGKVREYTKAELKRVHCVRCGDKPCWSSWTACADGGLHRPICMECDILLNRMVLLWMHDPAVRAKIAAYTTKLITEKVT